MLIIPFHFSNAQSALDIVTNPVKSGIAVIAWAVSTILYIVGYAFSILVFLGGLFFNWTLELNAAIVDNPTVLNGWKITRDMANLGFVFMIIIVAFSTMLRMGNLQMKQALPKLIVAAILINFSLLFATLALDIAGVFMNFFFNNAYTSGSGKGGISIAISTALNAHSGLAAPSASISSGIDLTVFGKGTMEYIARIVFLDIMTIVSAITMFAMAIMFLIRYVYIGLLLILLPGAVLMWAIGNSQWNTWLDKFFKYTFFGPIAGFFIYIALHSTLAFENMAKDYMAAPAKGSLLAGLAGNFASMIMMVFLLLGGLMAAEKMSIMGAAASVKMAKGAAAGFLKGTASSGFKGIDALQRKITGGKGMAERASEWGKNSKSKFVRGITRPFRQYGGETTKGLERYPGIMSGVFAGIDANLGGKAYAFKIKEEKEYEKRAKKEAIKKEREKIKQAKTDELARIDSEAEANSNKLKEAYAQLKLVESAQKENKATLEGGISLPPNDRERMEQAKKEYDKQTEDLLEQTIKLEAEMKNTPSQKKKIEKEIENMEKQFKEEDKASETNKELMEKLEALGKKLEGSKTKEKESK